MSRKKREPWGPVDTSTWVWWQHLVFWVIFLPFAAVVTWLGDLLLTVLRS